MAATAISLRFRSHKIRAIRDPSFSMLFSSSSTPEPPSNNEEESQSSFSSYFSDVKSSVNQQQQYPFPRKPISPISTQKPSNMASLEEINKNLFEFRRLSAPPPAAASDNSYPSHQISFQELYKRDAISKGGESTNPNEPIKLTERSFNAIRGSLKQFQDKNQDGGGIGINKMAKTTSRSKFTESLLGPRKSTSVAGGTEPLPASVFGKESEKKSAAQSETMKTEFVKNYDYGELGDKLRSLRSEEALNKGEKWFSLGELNERLVKLRDMEEKEMKSRIGGFYYNDLRESLVKLKISDNMAKKNSYHHKIETLSKLGGTPHFMLSPPKDNLVIKYFHPDNMSSAEKMKIELKKVRNEFKMSESDCGSARVQVAQLTTKIKHLSTALHKKDKHSRKGLQAMVQQRKKLLKYLRRTDWDSYCLVLSKLGLRDNPDYKN